MPTDSFRHQRGPLRLPGYDYTQAGVYFVTINVLHRECLFGEVIDEAAILSEAGQVADACWGKIPAHFPQVKLDVHIIMPNHVHGLIIITGEPSSVVGTRHAVSLPVILTK